MWCPELWNTRIVGNCEKEARRSGKAPQLELCREEKQESQSCLLKGDGGILQPEPTVHPSQHFRSGRLATSADGRALPAFAVKGPLDFCFPASIKIQQLFQMVMTFLRKPGNQTQMTQ